MRHPCHRPPISGGSLRRTNLGIPGQHHRSVQLRQSRTATTVSEPARERRRGPAENLPVPGKIVSQDSPSGRVGHDSRACDEYAHTQSEPVQGSQYDS